MDMIFSPLGTLPLPNLPIRALTLSPPFSSPLSPSPPPPFSLTQSPLHKISLSVFPFLGQTVKLVNDLVDQLVGEGEAAFDFG